MRLSILVVLLAALLCTGCPSNKPETTGTGQQISRADYGDVYWSESKRVITEMWTQEQDTIDGMTARIAGVLRDGNKVVWDCTAGHSNIYEVEPTLPCLPIGGMISATQFSGQKETIDALMPGDMLVTNFINEQTVGAFKRGVYVVGVTDSYFRSPYFSEQDNNDKRPNYENLNLEDMSNQVFNSHVPGQVGLVSMPHTPEMKVGAGVGNFMIALYWFSVTEVANRMANGPDQPMQYAPKYYDMLMERLDTIYRDQKTLIWDTAREAAIKVGNGAKMWVESRPRSVWCDASGASMGLVFTNRFPKDQMPAGDIVFYAEVSDSTASLIVEEAKVAREKGCYIIAAGPANQTALKELADVYIDNLCPEGYGVFDIPGHDNGIGLMGSLVNSIVYGTFSVQMVDEMCKRDWYPKYYMCYNWGGASGGYFDWLGWTVDRVGY